MHVWMWLNVCIKILYTIFPLTLSLYVSFYVETDQNQILYLAHTAYFALFSSSFSTDFLCAHSFSAQIHAVNVYFSSTMQNFLFMVTYILCVFSHSFLLSLLVAVVVRCSMFVLRISVELMPDNNKRIVHFVWNRRHTLL